MNRPRSGPVAALLAVAVAVHAPDASGQGADTTLEGGSEPSRTGLLLWSFSSANDRILWAQWTEHLGPGHRGLRNNELIGLVYRGFYGGTFVTSHGDRGLALGLERVWKAGERGPFRGMVGFRTGLVYGYDQRLGWVADLTPVLPMFQPLLQGRVGPLTADLSWTWVVVSLTGGLSF